MNPNDMTNRTLGHLSTPAATQAAAELTTDLSTYITHVSANGKASTLYSADRQFAQLTLILQTAGPVVIGNRETLLPVTFGKGILLDTGVPLKLIVARGNRIYVASTSINTIKVLVEPVPWLEQITGILAALQAMGALAAQTTQASSSSSPSSNPAPAPAARTVTRDVRFAPVPRNVIPGRR